MLLFDKKYFFPNEEPNEPPDLTDEPNPEDTIGNEELDNLIERAGYAYDAQQDIFYSTLNPWQRKWGYCQLYDELAAPLGMIMDSEPIFFEYNNKKWMIGIWKGQYDMVSGGEIGVYKGILNLKIPGIAGGIFYNAASDDEMLYMSYHLKKNGQTLLTREGRHWWLTGFKLGDFAEPSELTMDIDITLANEEMRDALITGLRNAGYTDQEFFVSNNTVSFIFDVPHNPQPLTRIPATDKLIQKKNKFLCDKFNDLTGSYNTVPEKLKAVEELAPDLYKKILKPGKNFRTPNAVFITILGAIIIIYFINRRTERSGSSFWRLSEQLLHTVSTDFE